MIQCRNCKVEVIAKPLPNELQLHFCKPGSTECTPHDWVETVFVVLKCFDVEGCVADSVWKSRISAEVRIESITPKDIYDYEIEEMELRE